MYKKIVTATLLLLSPCFMIISSDNLNNSTPLMFAAARGTEVSILKILLGGADINAQDKNGRTALMYAIYPAFNDSSLDYAPVGIRGRPKEIVQALLDHRADINKADKDGNTPLMHAITSGQLDLVTLLLSYKPYLTPVNKFGKAAYQMEPLFIRRISPNMRKSDMRKSDREELVKNMAELTKTMEERVSQMLPAGQPEQKKVGANKGELVFSEESLVVDDLTTVPDSAKPAQGDAKRNVADAIQDLPMAPGGVTLQNLQAMLAQEKIARESAEKQIAVLRTELAKAQNRVRELEGIVAAFQ